MMESKRSFPFVAGCLVLLVIGCCRIAVDASPSGAPPEACATMTPQHGVDWQQKDCPFEIIVEKSTIYASESLKIQLGIKSGVDVNDPFSRGFKGFMIMAFDATFQNIEPIGIFDGTTPNSEIQTMDCPTPSKGPNYKAPKSGVTHTNNGFKKSVEVLWTPPADLLGPIIISATFVHEKDVIWVKESSSPVQIVPDPGTTPTVPTTTTQSTTSILTTTEETKTTTTEAATIIPTTEEETTTTATTTEEATIVPTTEETATTTTTTEAETTVPTKEEETTTTTEAATTVPTTGEETTTTTEAATTVPTTGEETSTTTTTDAATTAPTTEEETTTSTVPTTEEETTTTTTTTPKPTTQGAASSVAGWTVLFGVVTLSFLL